MNETDAPPTNDSRESKNWRSMNFTPCRASARLSTQQVFTNINKTIMNTNQGGQRHAEGTRGHGGTNQSASWHADISQQTDQELPRGKHLWFSKSKSITGNINNSQSTPTAEEVDALLVRTPSDSNTNLRFSGLLWDFGDVLVWESIKKAGFTDVGSTCESMTFKNGSSNQQTVLQHARGLAGETTPAPLHPHETGSAARLSQLHHQLRDYQTPNLWVWNAWRLPRDESSQAALDQQELLETASVCLNDITRWCNLRPQTSVTFLLPLLNTIEVLREHETDACPCCDREIEFESAVPIELLADARKMTVIWTVVVTASSLQWLAMMQASW
jgi:hypothetical protein